MLNRRRFVGLATASALANRRAYAQSWPNRYVRLVVPFPAGGGTDAIARVVAGKLSEIWGQQLVVENRGGVSTISARRQSRAPSPMATPCCCTRSRSR